MFGFKKTPPQPLSKREGTRMGFIIISILFISAFLFSIIVPPLRGG
jgi:hypothetical protein